MLRRRLGIDVDLGICDIQNAERQDGDTQNTAQGACSGNSVHTSDGSPSEGRDRG